MTLVASLLTTDDCYIDSGIMKILSLSGTKPQGVEMAAKIILNLWPSMFMVSGGNILGGGSIPVIIKAISTELK